MANVKTTNPDATVLSQCTLGYRQRQIICRDIVVAAARTNNSAPNLIMADAIQNETLVRGFGVMPCNGRVLRITANGTPFVDMATSGTVTAKLSKAVIGGTDIDLCSTIAIGAATVPTADTAIDAVLSTTSSDLDLLNGQHIYLTVAVSNHAVEAIGYVTVMMEWMPTEE